MAIRLLALDLDGTLLNRRGEISERNARAIHIARERGVLVAVVTGRRFRDARPLALQLNLDDVPLISHNGALTKHTHTLETIAVSPLPLDAAHEVLRVGREFGADPLVSVDPHGAGSLLYDRISDHNAALVEYIQWAERIHGDEAGDAVRKVDAVENYLSEPPIHISFSGPCLLMHELRRLLEQGLGQKIKVYATVYPKLDFTLLDILNPAASKGVGVAAAAGEAGIASTEVMAIGDNHNDVEMLRYAGTSVLMANAEADMHEALDGIDFHTTGTNDEDGVAAAIEKFILGR